MGGDGGTCLPGPHLDPVLAGVSLRRPGPWVVGAPAEKAPPPSALPHALQPARCPPLLVKLEDSGPNQAISAVTCPWSHSPDLPSVGPLKGSGTACLGWTGTWVPVRPTDPAYGPAGTARSGSDLVKVTRRLRPKQRLETGYLESLPRAPLFPWDLTHPLLLGFKLLLPQILPKVWLGSSKKSGRGRGQSWGGVWDPGGHSLPAAAGRTAGWGGSRGGSGDGPSPERRLGREQDDPIPGDLPRRRGQEAQGGAESCPSSKQRAGSRPGPRGFLSLQLRLQCCLPGSPGAPGP